VEKASAVRQEDRTLEGYSMQPFCAGRNIKADVELIRVEDITERSNGS
jgi:hypothetical protein